MGCDIHCFIESRNRERGGIWWPFGGGINPGRDYQIFGRLAGVRDTTQVPVAARRGLPDDPSWKVQEAHEEERGDAHSASWVTPQEWWMAALSDEDLEAQPGYHAVHAAARALEDKGEEVRIVFWFDN